MIDFVPTARQQAILESGGVDYETALWAVWMLAERKSISVDAAIEIAADSQELQRKIAHTRLPRIRGGRLEARELFFQRWGY